MSDPIQRGSVVLCGRRRSVVWDVRGDKLVLVPVIVPVRFFRHDVLLSLSDLFAMGVPVPAIGQAPLWVRPVRSLPVAHAGHEVVGAVPPRTMCRVVHGVARAIAEAEVELKLLAERRQRRRVSAERCVNPHG